MTGAARALPRCSARTRVLFVQLPDSGLVKSTRWSLRRRQTLPGSVPLPGPPPPVSTGSADMPRHCPGIGMCECFSSRPKSPNESVLVVTAGHRPLVGGADLWPDWFGPVLGWNRPVPGARRTSVCVGLAGPSPCTQDGAAGCRETKPVCPPPSPSPMLAEIPGIQFVCCFK